MEDDKILPFTRKPGIIVAEHNESGCMAWTCWCGGSSFRLDFGGALRRSGATFASVRRAENSGRNHRDRHCYQFGINR